MLTSPLARIHSPRRIPNPPRAVRMTFYLLSCHQRCRRAPRQAPRSPARPQSSQRPLPVPPSVSPPPLAPSEQEDLGEEEPRTVGPSGQGPCRRHPSDPATPVQAAEPVRCVSSSSYTPTRHPAPRRLRASLPAGAFRDRMYLDQKEQSAFFRPRRLGSRELNSL